jgi:hypothetical protein
MYFISRELSMKTSFRARLSLVVLMGSLSIGTTSAVSISPPTPEELQVPKGQTLLLKTIARGDQVYTCQAKQSDPGDNNQYERQYERQYEWQLKAPDANLFDEQNRRQGQHYLGPTWAWNDGSQVVGKVKNKVDAPTPDTIPWLLLEAQPSETSASGILTTAKWIQRVNTTGGQAPQSGCDRTTENREVRVEYTADYYFYGDREQADSTPLERN